MRLDEKIAVIGFLFGLVLMLLSSFIRIGWGLSFTLSVSTLVYLFLSRRKSTLTLPLSTVRTQKGKTSYIFMIGVTIAILIFLMYSTSYLLYHRPVGYFLVASILSLIISLEIYLFATASRVWLILLQILLLATSLRWGILFEFPGFVGVDPWFYAFLTKNTIDTGHYMFHAVFPFDEGILIYNNFPIMEIMASMMYMAASLTIKQSMIVAIGGFEIISLVFVFLVARIILGDEQSALFSSLLVGISNWHLVWGFWLIPTSMGLGFFALIVWLVYKRYECYRGLSLTTTTLLLIFTLVLTHTISSFILFIALSSISGGEFLYHELFSRDYSIKRSSKKIVGSIAIFALVLMILFWTSGSDFLVERMGRLVYELRFGEIASIEPITRSYVHFELDNLGTYIFYALTVVGCLNWLRYEHRNLVKFGLFTTMVIIFFIMYGMPFFGINSITPERWFAFLFVIIALPAAEVLTKIGRSLRWKHMFVASLLVLSLTFVMITTGDANIDSPIYWKQEVPRFSTYLTSEMEAANVVTAFYNGSIYVDGYYVDYFNWVLRRTATILDFSEAELYSVNGVILRRKYIYQRPTIPYEGAHARAPVSLEIEKKLEKLNKIYCNGEVAMFWGGNRSTKP